MRILQNIGINRLKNYAMAIGFIAFLLLTGLAAIPQLWQFIIDSIYP